jgi:hypothetical protein
MGNHSQNIKIENTKIDNKKNENLKTYNYEKLPKINGDSILLDENIQKQLLESLPYEKRNEKEWILLYSTKRDGFSIISFSDKLMHKGPSILLIKSTKNNIIVLKILNNSLDLITQ